MTTPLPKVGAPALRALEHEGIRTLEQLAKRSEAEISELHGMGPKALRILSEALREAGLSYRPIRS